MNRCKICGALNEGDAFLCSTCKSPLREESYIEKPSMILDSVFGILFITYGIAMSIANLILLDKLLLDPFLFLFIGIYSISTNVSVSSAKNKVRILEIQYDRLQQKIQNLENKMNDK